MNSITDGLRKTPKGQLVYNRDIEGKALTDLLHKCATSPALSSPHTEITPPCLQHSASFGLGQDKDSKEEEIIHFSLDLEDHHYSKDVEDGLCDPGEKGEQDSLERETSSHRQSTQREGYQSRSAQVQGSRSPLSPRVTSQSPLGGSPASLENVSPQNPPTQGLKHPQILGPNSPQVVSPKSPQVVSPKTPRVVSPRSPPIVSPLSSETGSLERSQLVSIRRPYVLRGESLPGASPRSPAGGDDGEDGVGPPPGSPPGSPMVTLNLTTGRSLSRPQETGEGEEEGTEATGHEDLTVSFTGKLHAITDMEMSYDNQSKEMMEKKQHQFLLHQTHLNTQQEELVSLVERQHLQDMSLIHVYIEKKQQSKRQEMQQAVQKVKETHQQCWQRQDARLRQVEVLGQHLKEEKARREQALEQKVEEVRAMAHRITANKTALVTLLEQCPHRQHLSEVAEKTKLLVRKLSEQAEGVAGSLTRSGPLEEQLARLKQSHEQSQNALDFAHNLIAEAEKKAKAAAAEAEKQRQQALSAQPPQVGQSTAGPQGAQASSAPQPLASGEEGALLAVAKEYESNKKLLAQMDAALDSFVSDQQVKKVRFDLQRAVNTPVNAISPVSSAHLKDKLLRLCCLLRGEGVEVVGKQVSAQAAPQGLTFCKNLVAKMIVRKADEQVSSNHESAFAIAAVAVGLWAEFPEVGDLIMAHLQALCPYVLPFYPPRLPNQSSEDYHSTLGYKVVEGSIEQQDKFLRRMSGILRLYAAILVTSPPQGRGRPHPHGLEHAWVWLSRSMNLQPNPDITATAIYDMLQVCGCFLLRAYSTQFVKLLHFLIKVFLPRLKEVAAGSGPVIRLQTFLETAWKNNALIPEPEGFLQPHFFLS